MDDSIVTSQLAVSVAVNGVPYTRAVEPRLLLSDFLRHELELTGTHVGCEHGVCGACTVLLDGEAVRSCIVFAVQCDGHEITTVEGLAGRHAGETLHPLQKAFHESHALQCGFCTPGILMTLVPFLRDNPAPSEREAREAIAGNLCRCTGYQNIVDAILLAAAAMEERESGRTAGGVGEAIGAANRVPKPGESAGAAPPRLPSLPRGPGGEGGQ